MGNLHKKMGLLTALYVYFIFVPKMLLMNLFKRFSSYTPKNQVMEEDEFFKQSKNQEWMSNWMASNRFLKSVLRTAKIQALKETVQGGPAIDVELYDLAEKSTVKLFDFMKTNRPLVLNFGSCT